MRLDQAVAMAKRLIIHNDLDYVFVKAENNSWLHVSTKKQKPNGEAYTPRQLLELALREP